MDTPQSLPPLGGGPLPPHRGPASGRWSIITEIALVAGVVAAMIGCAGGADSPGPEGPAVPRDGGQVHDATQDTGQACATPAPGCPCSPGQSAACYPGPAGTEGVGLCHRGTMLCLGSTFGDCLGAVTPSEELCNGLDDDCDGHTDEDVPGCDECQGGDCFVYGVGPGREYTFSGGEALGERVEVTEDGELTLSARELVLNDVWIANTDEGTVSRLDGFSGAEIARYASALPVAGLRPWDEPCDKRHGHGNCPSRTAVTLDGDVFVANRAFGGQGSLTKILGAGCPDLDGDGVVETSSDVDHDGHIDLDDPAEFLGAADECIAFTVPVGGQDAVLRALAVDPFYPPGTGSVWVGAYNEQAVYRVDAATGEILVRRSLPLHPYGAAMAQDGTLWITSLAGVDDAIVAVDTITLRVGEAIPVHNSHSCTDNRSKGGYGIALDGNGRVWIGGWVCEAALRYDPAHDEWLSVQLPGKGYTRGITVDSLGRVWVAHSHQAHSPFPMVGRVTRFDGEDGGDMVTYELTDQAETIGVGVDVDGRIWAVSKHTDTATRIDPETGEQEHHQVGRGPYTYSDFTGYALRTFVAPAGLWTTTIEGCGASTIWRRLVWDAEVPEGARLQIYVRAATHRENLATAYRYGPFTESPADLSRVPYNSKLLKIEVELESNSREAAPVLRWIQVEATCPQEDAY